jgi:glycosyltransferase involved in cell wall biosynthesis
MEIKHSDNARKKLLLLIPNLGRGGAQQVFRQQYAYLSKDFEVTGCVFNWDGAFPEDRHHKMVSLNVPGGKTLLAKAWYFILRIVRLRKLKQAKLFQVSISHLEGADYVNLLSSNTDKTICWIHGTKRHDANIEGWLGSIRMNWLMPLLYNRADQLITVSQGIADELSGVIPGLKPKLKVIYNGFDVEQISSLSMQPLDGDLINLFNTSKVLITHCRLSRQKNLEGLLTIYSKIDHRNTRLVIIGDGELRVKLIQECLQLGLSVWSAWDNTPVDANSNVYFMGQQANPFKYLRNAFIYLMTSGWEGFPLALCEAMACGLPVITSDCFTGPREIIAPEINSTQPLQEPYFSKYGVLMPLASLNDSFALDIWVNAIKYMLRQENLRLYQEAGVVRIKKFELSKSMNQTINLIQEIIYEKARNTGH